MLKIVGTLKGSRLFKSATLSSSNADLKEAIKQAQSQTPASNNNETLSPVASPIRKSESNPTQIFHEKETIEFLDSQPKLSSGGSIYCLVCQNVVTQVVSVPVDNPCRCSLGLEVSSSENTGAAASEDLTPIEFGTIRCCFRCITEELDKGTTPSCSKCGRAVVFSKEAQPPVSIESLNSFLDPTLQQEIDQLPTYCKYNSRWWAKRVEQRREMFKQAAPSENSELASEVSEEQMSKLLEAAAEDVEIPENQSETEAKPKGCEDIIPLGKREEHQLVCNFVPVVCGQRDTERRGELCTHECPRGSLSEHRTICAYRTQKCPNEACHRQVSLRSLARHLPLCEFQQVSCPNGCNKKVLKIGLENHTYQDCVMSCDWDIDEYVKKEGLSPEEHVDLLKKKVKFQTEKAKQLSQEISRYEKMHESTHPENFTGIYFVPLYEPKCRNADYEWICKVYDSKYKNEFRQHLTAVLLNESHPVGRVFHEVRVNTLENCASARRNLSAEVISKIGSMLLVKAGIVHKSVVATWPLYKEIESCREFIQNLLISLVYEQVFALYLSKNATDDKNLSQKMIELSSLTPTHLGIRKEFCLNMDIETGATKKTQDTDYDSDADSATSSNEPKQYVFSAGAINIFKQIFEFANVKEKIDCLVATIQLICNSVKNFLATTGQKETEDIGFVSADDLLPMLCFVVVHAGVPNLFSELRFIIDFSRDEKELSGQTGYCISMLEGAMEHILTLNYEELIQQHGPPLTDSSDSVTDSPGETSNVHVPIVENTTATNDNNSEQSAGPKGPSMEHEWRIVCDLDANETMFARYSCCHNSLTRKGSLYVSTNYLVFIPTGKDKNDQKVKINFKDIYSVHKTKFAVVDNSIDVYIKVDKEKEKEHEVDFVIYKFVHFDNVTQAFVQICKIHQTVQLTLESPITPLLIHDQSIDYSDEFLDVEFSKLRNGLLNGVYDCETEEEAYLYTAVLCHVTMGDWSPTKYRPSFIRAKVKLIPPAFRENFSEDQIYEQFKRLKGANEIVAKLYFVMRIRAVVRKMMGRYGLQIFFVKEGLSDKKVKPVILGISREAILRMDIETLEVISQHSLSEVTRISANQNNLIIDYSSAEASFYQCRTNQAQYITEIFNGMIKAILSRDY